MKRICVLLLTLLMVSAMILINSCSTSKLTPGQAYHGFKLIKTEFIDEVNSDCYYFEHEKSGARLLKIANDDPNKTFCATFKTLPQSDCGTPHILEHSVLNGSQSFPVKSPFDVLSKGSLNTFLNAMTGGDITLYPVASMNDKDFRNLMHVYLDAVFFPNIYDDPRIFQQEGWHHELESADAPVIYKGVVYNEMKGAFSDPNRELGYYINKNLFPDNCYQYSSGGYPQAIPKLAYENFINFHKKYYHPTNCYLYLYGNSEILSDLKFIDREYLTKFEKLDKRAKITPQKPYAKIKKIVESYPISENHDIANKTFLAMDWVIGAGDDQILGFYLDILADALVNHESGPIKLALLEAGIGQDISAYNSSSKQNQFQITVKNANLADLDKFHDIVMTKLEEISKKGIDRNVIEGIVNRMEFRLREGDNAQKGMDYLFKSLQSWFYAEEPFRSLKWENPLAEMKKGLEKNKLENLINTGFLQNTHSLIIALTPKPGLQNERNQQVEEELTKYKATLTEHEKTKLIQDTKDLIAYQQEKDTPEALATIPMLNLEDISPNVDYYTMTEVDVHGAEALHHSTFTNKILYSKLLFDTRVVPQKQIPYLALLAEVLGSLNTENFTFGELDNELNKHLGGFSTYLTTYREENDDDKLLPKFLVQTKSINLKANKMFELVEEILTKSKIDDKDRLKTLLSRHQSRLYGHVMGNGINIALTRLNSYYSPNGQLNELTRGYSYYEFVTKLHKNYDAEYDNIVMNLNEVAQILFNSNNLVAAITCDNNDLALYKNELHNFAHKLDNKKVEHKKWNFDYQMKNEGIMSPSKVQYVTKGYNFKKLGHKFDGKIHVLNQVITREWLYQQIRVIGGAYGGFCGFTKPGIVYFASYRDPNLAKTLENIDGTAEFLTNFKPTEDEMTRFIIGTISNLEQPLSPSQKGNEALSNYFTKTNKEELQAERTAVLNTKAEDIQQMADFVQSILDNSGICVYGNEEIIKENENLFKSVFTIK